MPSWCGLKKPGDNWLINIHSCTTLSLAKRLAAYGGKDRSFFYLFF